MLVTGPCHKKTLFLCELTQKYTRTFVCLLTNNSSPVAHPQCMCYFSRLVLDISRVTSQNSQYVHNGTLCKYYEIKPAVHVDFDIRTCHLIWAWFQLKTDVGVWPYVYT